MTTSYQVHKHTHVLFGQPVEESCWIGGKDLVILDSGDGLDTLLQLLQARLHTLYLNTTTNEEYLLLFALYFINNVTLSSLNWL